MPRHRTSTRIDEEWRRRRALRTRLRDAAVERALELGEEALERLIEQKETAVTSRLHLAVAKAAEEVEKRQRERAKPSRPFVPPAGIRWLSEAFNAAWKEHNEAERARKKGPAEDEAVTRRKAIHRSVRNSLTAIELEALLPGHASEEERKEAFSQLLPFAALEMKEAAREERPHQRWVELAEWRATYPFRMALRTLRART